MIKIMGIVTGLLFSSAAAGEVAAQWRSSLGIESFNWFEYDASGAEIVHESGPRLFAELGRRSEYSPRLGAIYSGRLYGGSVGYDGQTQTGTPVTTNSLYLGLRLEAMFDYRLPGAMAASHDWFLHFGLGYDSWVRGIQDTPTASGYNERYQVSYSKLGVVFDTNQRIRVQFGAKFPVMVREDVDYSRFATDDTGENFADLQLAPRATTTLYAAVDYRMTARWNVSLYYDHYLFEASPSENLLTASGSPVYCLDTNGDGVCEALNAIDSGSDRLVMAFQPKSDHRTIGVRLTFGY